MSTSKNTNPVKMPSGSHATRDVLVTVKVLFAGYIRRTKMHLHELVPVILEQNIRALLQIPNGTTLMIERFSDSAAAFVMLDTANTSVYKQLHRAAKAKSRVKLRVSFLYQSESVAPQPAAVKDVPEPVDAVSSEEPEPADTCPYLALPVTSPYFLPPKHKSGRRPEDLMNKTNEDLPIRNEMPSLAQNPENSGESNLEQTKLEGLASQMANYRPFSYSTTLPMSSQLCTPIRPVEEPLFAVRCNNCEKTMPDAHYHCETCDDGDFDLCQSCVDLGATCIGNHWMIKRRMKNGQFVNSTTEIFDWGYRDGCVRAADPHHPKHRFGPLYEPVAHPGATFASQQVHTGICCDGPLCTSPPANNSYIRGVRYKCAVCHDLDFCANCEASPSNEHNKSHPLYKLNMPVHNLPATYFAESHDGTCLRTKFDRPSTASKTAVMVLPRHQNSMNAVQTVMDVKPIEATATPLHTAEGSVTEPKPELQCKEEDLRAVFLRDSVADGTIFPPNHVFEQTWYLRNEGKETWPAGCCVKFVGGDYMGHVDPSHPAGIGELVSASESTVCYVPLGPGQEFPFTSLLRTPSRPGKMISYWRLTTPDGTRFGHRLWCEINVRAPVSSFTPAPDRSSELKPNETSAVSSSVELSTNDSAEVEGSMQSSNALLFPKFDQECLDAGMPTHDETETVNDAGLMDAGHVEEDDEWGDELDFLTDDEYDVLDASDDEFLQEHQETLSKK